MKNNIITYAYRGFLSFIYFIIGKKKKISEMFILDSSNAFNMDTSENNVFVKRGQGSFGENNELVDKIHYRYTGINKKGKKVNGTFDAYNEEQVRKYMVEQGLNPKSVSVRGKYDFDINIGKPLSLSELSFALTQISTYLRAGITLIDSVRILSKQTVKPSKKKIYDMKPNFKYEIFNCF